MKQRRDQSKKSIQRRQATSIPEPDSDPRFPDTPVIRPAGPLVAQNPEQERYIKAIKSARVVFGLGRAGTGKSYIAGALGAQGLTNREVGRIILTRPAEEAGEKLGFLPGELDEKYEPYIRPFRDVLNERLGPSQVRAMFKGGRIEAIPLGFMRGMTFKNCIAILDEAQNTTPVQMKMFLTRLGEGCTMIINGDLQQKDIPGPSGLQDAIDKIGHLPSVRVVRLVKSVRDDMVQQILDAYDNNQG